MNVDARINLNLSQRLVMTPMLQQAIKLLQMSRIELVDLVKQEMLENPVLDELEEHGEQHLERKGEAAPENGAEYSESGPLHDTVDERNNKQDSVNWEEFFNDNPGSLGYYGEYEHDDDTMSYDNLFTQSSSLSEHLSWQLQMSQLPERNMKIGRFLIGQIDEDGYFPSEEPEQSALLQTDLKPRQLKEYRSSVIDMLCQKVNAEFEREYLSSALDYQDLQGILANVLLQEYYDELSSGRYEECVGRLQSFTLEDLQTIAKLLRAIPAEQIEKLTGIPADEIRQGIERISNLCHELQHILETHCRVLLHESYTTKLEKLNISPEELYALEYFVLQLSAEEIAYIAGKENEKKAAKYENEVQEFLEKLRQSYAHIDQLKSHRYFLIQLYTVGVGLIIERFRADSPVRFQRLFLKLIHITKDDVAAMAQHISSLLPTFYQHEQRVTHKEVEHVLRHIQTFTPSGVGARDLKECLVLQARNLGIEETPLEVIINDYLDELNRHQYERIVEKLGLSFEDVESIQNIIFNMSPKPGADFTYVRPEYIVPDIYVYKVDGEYEVVLNEDDLPNLRINPTYKKIITGNHNNVTNATKQYVDQKLRSAMWFIRSVEQRKRTIYKVGKSIVKFQQDFLEHGVTHLKPLVLRDVADDISMHESTVSRVTTNKYIHTPQGVFELKYFFHSGLESSSGDDISSIAIKQKIKQIIDEEDCQRPLSDKAIEKMLKAAGVAIARRTIAKYREELNIPSSIQRKRKKTSNGQ